MPVLWSSGNSILREIATLPARTDEIRHTVGWERIIVIGHVSLVRPASCQLACLHAAKPAIADTSFRDPAALETRWALDSVFGPRRVLRKTESPATLVVNRFYSGPHFRKMLPHAVGTIAYSVGNRNR
jgi:hypothetical protein